MAKIQLNGKKITINAKETLFGLLAKYKLNNKKIAVEHNGLIVPKTIHKKRILKDKDVVEVVHFIGGG